MKPAHLLLSSALLSTLLPGCGGIIDGVWQLSMQAAANVDENCQESISHNFSDSWVPADEEESTDWTSSEQDADSDQVFFALVTSTAAGAATLIIGTAAYPGIEEANGSWTFTWTDLSTSSESDVHATGYAWSATSDEAREVVYQLVFNGEVVNGTMDTATTASYNWSESDSWPAESLAGYLSGDGTVGQIPASTYLVTDDWESGTEVAASNSSEIFDCDDSECAINRLYTCSATYELDGTRTSLSSGEDYEGVSGAGQSAGY